MNTQTLAEYTDILNTYREKIIEVGKDSAKLNSQQFKYELERAHNGMIHELFQLVLKRIDEVDEKIIIRQKISDEIPF